METELQTAQRDVTRLQEQVQSLQEEKASVTTVLEEEKKHLQDALEKEKQRNQELSTQVETLSTLEPTAHPEPEIQPEIQPEPEPEPSKRIDSQVATNALLNVLMSQDDSLYSLYLPHTSESPNPFRTPNWRNNVKKSSN